MTVKDDIYRLIEELPEHELVTARRLLEELRDRAAGLPRVLPDAPLDDEPVTDEDRAAIAEAQADVAAGRVVPHAEARRRLLGRSWPGRSTGPSGR
jgi:predicted transcriptional regulator